MTIKDIARESGYSVSTVSRVLNHRSDVSEEARAKIMEIVNRHNFVLNNNAKQLKQIQSKSIAVMVKGTSNMLFASIVEEIQKLVVRTKYQVNVIYLDEYENEVENAILLCREKKPIGILFLGGNPEYFKADFDKVPIPCVLVTNSSKDLGFSNLSSVCTDDIHAAKCAMDYLVGKGHTKIAIIGGNLETSYTSRLRLKGSLESFQEHNIMYEQDLYYEKARYSYESAYEATERLLERKINFTAVFAMSDVMAIGVIRALRDHKKSVPEDISVIGFDGITLAGFYNPKIATIKQNSKELATEGISILMEMIDLEGMVSHKVVPFQFVEGESIKELQ